MRFAAARHSTAPTRQPALSVLPEPLDGGGCRVEDDWVVQDRRVPGMSAKARVCPDCDFSTENSAVFSCPKHGKRLVSPKKTDTN